MFIKSSRIYVYSCIFHFVYSKTYCVVYSKTYCVVYSKTYCVVNIFAATFTFRFTGTVQNVLESEWKVKKHDVFLYFSHLCQPFQHISIKDLFISAIPLILYLSVFKSYLVLKEVCYFHNNVCSLYWFFTDVVVYEYARFYIDGPIILIDA